MTVIDDPIWVIDRKTGCYFKGSTLIHQDACMCDEDYQYYKDSQL